MKSIEEVKGTIDGYEQRLLRGERLTQKEIEKLNLLFRTYVQLLNQENASKKEVSGSGL